MNEHLMSRFDALDRALVARGFTPTSGFWRSAIQRFYATGRRQLVSRVGRRGGKSSTLCRVAVLEALYGEHAIPSGDVGVVAFISVSRDEASQRLRTIKAILDAIGIAWRPVDGGIELVGKPVAFKVFAASIAGVSGFTCICAICDEVAKWRDADTGANPATDVLASFRPTMATQPRAKLFLSSSPVGLEDAHAKAFADGDTAFQVVVHAATWIANPSVSETETHELEPDNRIWTREYAAVPQAGALAAFDHEAVDRAFNLRADLGTPRARIMVLDPSSGKKDTWTFGVCGWNDTPRGPFLRFDLVGGVEGAFWQQVTGAALVEKLAAIAEAHGVRHVHADQRESFMLTSEFNRHKLAYTVHDWTAQSKPAAVEHVRRWFATGALSLVEHEKLRRELFMFEERITPSGQFTFAARGSGHDDYVSLLVTAAMADIAGDLPLGDGNAFMESMATFRAMQPRARWTGPSEMFTSARGFPPDDGDNW